MQPEQSLTGNGSRERESGASEVIEDVQMFFYADGRISGSFVCRTPESDGILWLFKNGNVDSGTIRFDMVHIQLRYSRDPVATFIGEYDGEGTYFGSWNARTEKGRWQISLRDTLKPHSPGPDWYT